MLLIHHADRAMNRQHRANRPTRNLARRVQPLAQLSDLVHGQLLRRQRVQRVRDHVEAQRVDATQRPRGRDQGRMLDVLELQLLEDGLDVADPVALGDDDGEVLDLLLQELDGVDVAVGEAERFRDVHDIVEHLEVRASGAERAQQTAILQHDRPRHGLGAEARRLEDVESAADGVAVHDVAADLGIAALHRAAAFEEGPQERCDAASRAAGEGDFGDRRVAHGHEADVAEASLVLRALAEEGVRDGRDAQIARICILLVFNHLFRR